MGDADRIYNDGIVINKLIVLGGAHLFHQNGIGFPEGSPFTAIIPVLHLKASEFHTGFNKQHQCIGQMKFSLCL